MVVDAIDVIVHIFTEDSREYYALEHMWQTK
ncbi:MAG: RsfS/YbeB/iojap family protein [Alphaproteobacteria bacterium]|nr:RsfS/YbeB/iojap family protein [Alphaproteobacteria bacterium]